MTKAVGQNWRIGEPRTQDTGESGEPRTRVTWNAIAKGKSGGTRRKEGILQNKTSGYKNGLIISVKSNVYLVLQNKTSGRGLPTVFTAG
jgi:hypothetical protein